MDIVKTATDWTRAEMLSSAFFILFGLSFLLASLGFWQLGRTDMAKAYVVPMLVAGTLILIIGVGLFISSQARLTSFPADYAIDAAGFVADEVARADRVLNEYRIAVFRVVPLIIAVCALAIPSFEHPIWRATLITTIAMMAVILVIDNNANKRWKAIESNSPWPRRPKPSRYRAGVCCTCSQRLLTALRVAAGLGSIPYLPCNLNLGGIRRCRLRSSLSEGPLHHIMEVYERMRFDQRSFGPRRSHIQRQRAARKIAYFQLTAS